MLAALIGPALVFITGISVPFGLLLPADTMSYGHMLAFTHNWIGKLFVLAVIALLLWHAVHRIAILMHDFGVHAVAVVKVVCYGVALAGTIMTAWLLFAPVS
jgi:fumarate reductase subunit D